MGQNRKSRFSLLPYDFIKTVSGFGPYYTEVSQEGHPVQKWLLTLRFAHASGAVVSFLALVLSLTAQNLAEQKQKFTDVQWYHV